MKPWNYKIMSFIKYKNSVKFIVFINFIYSLNFLLGAQQDSEQSSEIVSDVLENCKTVMSSTTTSSLSPGMFYCANQINTLSKSTDPNRIVIWSPIVSYTHNELNKGIAIKTLLFMMESNKLMSNIEINELIKNIRNVQNEYYNQEVHELVFGIKLKHFNLNKNIVNQDMVKEFRKKSDEISKKLFDFFGAQVFCALGITLSDVENCMYDFNLSRFLYSIVCKYTESGEKTFSKIIEIAKELCNDKINQSEVDFSYISIDTTSLDHDKVKLIVDISHSTNSILDMLNIIKSSIASADIENLKIESVKQSMSSISTVLKDELLKATPNKLIPAIKISDNKIIIMELNAHIPSQKIKYEDMLDIAIDQFTKEQQTISIESVKDWINKNCACLIITS